MIHEKKFVPDVQMGKASLPQNLVQIMKPRIAIVLVPAGAALTATAGIRPGFALESCAQGATDIVVITQDQKLDGNCTVVEAWKGSLKPGQKITVPALARFAPETNRIIGGELIQPGETPFRGPGTRTVVSPWPDQPSNTPIHVSGKRMVLFLKRTATNSEDWEPADFYHVPRSNSGYYTDKELWLSVVWIDQGIVYAYEQEQNPGPSLLRPLQSPPYSQHYMSETNLKAEVLTVLKQPPAR